MSNEIETLKTRNLIERMFNPKSILFVGASSDIEKMSGQPIRNVKYSNFNGEIYAVNPRGTSIDGVKTFKSIEEIPQDLKIDLAFVTIPAKFTPDALLDLSKKG